MCSYVYGCVCERERKERQTQKHTMTVHTHMHTYAHTHTPTGFALQCATQNNHFCDASQSPSTNRTQCVILCTRREQEGGIVRPVGVTNTTSTTGLGMPGPAGLACHADCCT